MKTSQEIADQIRGSVQDAAGVSEITVDGIHIKIDADSLDYWERRAARESIPVRRPIAASIDLS